LYVGVISIYPSAAERGRGEIIPEINVYIDDEQTLCWVSILFAIHLLQELAAISMLVPDRHDITLVYLAIVHIV
jgi:hypothetical protein